MPEKKCQYKEINKILHFLIAFENYLKLPVKKNQNKLLAGSKGLEYFKLRDLNKINRRQKGMTQQLIRNGSQNNLISENIFPLRFKKAFI